MDWQHQVATFMREVKGLDLPTKPIIPGPLHRDLCKALMHEELAELCAALDAGDIVETADGLADLLYVVLYTANACGLHMDPIFMEVQRSNMAKKGGAKREDGKQLKPADWVPPNLASIVRAQQGL